MNELLMNWLLTYLAHSTLLIGALWALDRLVLGRDPVRRERLWRAALVVPLVSAGLQVAAPQFAVTEPVAVEYESAAPVVQVASEPALPARAESAQPVVIAQAAPTVEPWQWALGLWLLVAVAEQTAGRSRTAQLRSSSRR